MRSARVDAEAESFMELGKLADKEVEPAVIVVVKPHRPGAPSGNTDASTLGYISESSVPVVVIKDVSPVLSQVKVGKAVAVVVPHGDAHAVAPRHTGFLGDVGERAVAIVAIERIARSEERRV